MGRTKNGRSGIRRIEAIDVTPFDCKIAGEIRDFDADGYFGVPKDARRSDRYVQFAVAASKMAMADSGLDTGKIDARRYGVMVGSGIGGLQRWSASIPFTSRRGRGAFRLSRSR